MMTMDRYIPIIFVIAILAVIAMFPLATMFGMLGLITIGALTIVAEILHRNITDL